MNDLPADTAPESVAGAPEPPTDAPAWAGWSFETRQVHAGASPDPTTGARATPMDACRGWLRRAPVVPAEVAGWSWRSICWWRCRR